MCCYTVIFNFKCILCITFFKNSTFGLFRRGESSISSGTEEEGQTNVYSCPSWAFFISSTVWGSLFLWTQCRNKKSWSNCNFHKVYTFRDRIYSIIHWQFPPWVYFEHSLQCITHLFMKKLLTQPVRLVRPWDSGVPPT